MTAERWFTAVAIFVALASAAFTGWYAYEARRQAEITEQARRDAKLASDAQARDVERSRKAAEDSATAAALLADAALKSLSIADTTARTQARSLALAEQQFAAFRRAIHSGMQPLLYETNATVSGAYVSFAIANKGRMTAVLGKAWCGGGVWVPSDSGTVLTRIWQAAPEGIIRRSTIVPDSQERVELPVYSPLPGPVIKEWPSLASVKEPPIWLVVCDIPYSDDLDDSKVPPSHNLRFCYEIQRNCLPG